MQKDNIHSEKVLNELIQCDDNIVLTKNKMIAIVTIQVTIAKTV